MEKDGPAMRTRSLTGVLKGQEGAEERHVTNDFSIKEGKSVSNRHKENRKKQPIKSRTPSGCEIK